MSFELLRRQLLAGTAAFLPGLGLARRSSAATPNLTTLAVLRRNLSVRGKPAAVFGIQQPDGTPGLYVDPGQQFRVTLRNETAEPTIIHWHGQTPAPVQDGVTEFGASPISPGAARDYDFAARPGTHWMHSHHGLQEQLLLAAPLIVRTAEDLRADRQEVTVLLHDFTFRDPAEMLAGLVGRNVGQAGRSGRGTGHGGVPMPGMPHSASGMMDLNDVDYDAYLANDRTLDDPLVVRTERGGRVHLRLINGATSTAFWIDLGATEATVLAVDGNPVRPIVDRRFPLAQGQRLDLELIVAASTAVPVLAQREGDRQRTGIILAAPGARVAQVADMAPAAIGPIDLSLEQRLAAFAPLPAQQTDAALLIALTGTMAPYAWTIDDRAWGSHRPLAVRKGQRVVLEMANYSMMAHPMHLHGHHFQVVALNGRRVAGAMRDTVLVPAMGSVGVAFDADNPGRWLLHCHNLLHMATGMMTELSYLDIT